MPNLNLMDDGPEETPNQSLSPEEELGLDDSPGVWRKILPIAAGGLVALLLAVFVLNKTGIVHLWGPPKATSVMIDVPSDEESQMVSDSIMTESPGAGNEPDAAVTAPLIVETAPAKNAPAASETSRQAGKQKTTDAAAANLEAGKKKASAAETKKLAEEKKALAAAETKKRAEEKKALAAAEAKKIAGDKKAAAAAMTKKLAEEKTAAAAEAKKLSEEKKAAAAAAAAMLAEQKKAAEAERRNVSYVEVPGYPVRRSAQVIASKPAPRVITPGKQAAAPPAPEKTAAARPEPVKKTVMEKSPAPEKKPAAVKQPAAETKRVAVKEPAAVPASTTGQYTIQISSWPNEAKAQAEVRRYADAGMSAFMTTTGNIHRVCIGRYASQRAAAAAAEELTPMLETQYEIIRVK